MRSFCLIANLVLILASTAHAQSEDLLSRMNLRATEGAAAGYVIDEACGYCHSDLYESYQHVGMARSFARPEKASLIEDFGVEYYHEASGRYYRLDKTDNELTFKRYLKDDAGQPINVFEQAIDWIMGSGNRARSYLIQTEWGEIFQVPLGWYSEDHAWGMSPGFEVRDHPGLQRRVKRQCMFCHNAFPEVPLGSDYQFQNHEFPKNLPQGTGCQRCHGPGADHIRAVLSGSPKEVIHSRIVNPRKLEPEKRDSVCFQCHMLPAVAMIGVRRFERADYSFRPGEHVSDYLLHMEAKDATVPREDHFEINHHGYRMWQSACFQKSDGALGCISCHNPHVKPASGPFRESVGKVCLSCHTTELARLSDHDSSPSQCVSCHMPTRRTRDVVLVTMTDHRIARGPFDQKALVQPIQKTEPILTDVNLLPFGPVPTGATAQIYEISSTLRATTREFNVQAMEKALARTEVPYITPYMDLLKGQLSLHQYADAEQTARAILKRDPDQHFAMTWLAIAQIGQGKLVPAKSALRRSIVLNPTPEAHYNLGLIAFQEKNLDSAITQFENAIALRPFMVKAWLYRGRALLALDRWDEARTSFTRALQLDPLDTKSYVALVDLLRDMDLPDEATRYLQVGLRMARDPDQLKNPQTERSHADDEDHQE